MKNLHNKLLSRGAASLSDAELLAMLVESSGDARDPQQIADGKLIVDLIVGIGIQHHIYPSHGNRQILNSPLFCHLS